MSQLKAEEEKKEVPQLKVGRDKDLFKKFAQVLVNAVKEFKITNKNSERLVADVLQLRRLNPMDIKDDLYNHVAKMTDMMKEKYIMIEETPDLIKDLEQYFICEFVNERQDTLGLKPPLEDKTPSYIFETLELSINHKSLFNFIVKKLKTTQIEETNFLVNYFGYIIGEDIARGDNHEKKNIKNKLKTLFKIFFGPYDRYQQIKRLNDIQVRNKDLLLDPGNSENWNNYYITCIQIPRNADLSYKFALEPADSLIIHRKGCENFFRNKNEQIVYKSNRYKCRDGMVIIGKPSMPGQLKFQEDDDPQDREEEPFQDEFEYDLYDIPLFPDDEQAESVNAVVLNTSDKPYLVDSSIYGNVSIRVTPNCKIELRPGMLFKFASSIIIEVESIKTDVERQRELEKQAEEERQIELEKQPQGERQMELEKQAEEERQIELEKQPQGERQMELERQLEEERQMELEKQPQGEIEADNQVREEIKEERSIIKFTHIAGPDKDEVVELEAAIHSSCEFIVGRGGGGTHPDLYLSPQAKPSSKHALITYEDHKWYIQDTKSTNGTFLLLKNAEQYKNKELSEPKLIFDPAMTNDNICLVSIGSYIFYFSKEKPPGGNLRNERINNT